MIGLYEVKITNKKENHVIAVVEVVGGTKEQMEKDAWYQIRAMRNSGHDPSIEKYSLEKYTFKAELIKLMED